MTSTALPRKEDEYAKGGQSRETEDIDNNKDQRPWEVVLSEDPIKDYDVLEDIEGVDMTQNSTTRMTFPKVCRSLPNYNLTLVIIKRMLW